MSYLLDHQTPASQHLLLLTIQEIKITNHLTLRMSHNYGITLLLESSPSVERTDDSNVIAPSAMEFTNLWIKLMYLKLMPKKTQKILHLIGT